MHCTVPFALQWHGHSCFLPRGAKNATCGERSVDKKKPQKETMQKYFMQYFEEILMKYNNGFIWILVILDFSLREEGHEICRPVAL